MGLVAIKFFSSSPLRLVLGLETVVTTAAPARLITLGLMNMVFQFYCAERVTKMMSDGLDSSGQGTQHMWRRIIIADTMMVLPLFGDQLDPYGFIIWSFCFRVSLVVVSLRSCINFFETLSQRMGEWLAWWNSNKKQHPKAHTKQFKCFQSLHVHQSTKFGTFLFPLLVRRSFFRSLVYFVRCCSSLTACTSGPLTKEGEREHHRLCIEWTKEWRTNQRRNEPRNGWMERGRKEGRAPMTVCGGGQLLAN